MKITDKTKISTIIKYDKNVIDVIASINKHFRKLKNPILCKMLASRVSVSDAAKIGGISTHEFLKKLEDHGYEVDYTENNKEVNTKHFNNMINKDKVVTLDARPILAGGVDPFDEIMKTLKTMDDDQTLLIINTFEPVPLLNLLKKKGYEYETQRPEPGLIHCYLKKVENYTETTGNTGNQSKKNESFEDVEKRFNGKMKEIDVRDLEMPMPMVKILEKLETLSTGEALYVHHKRLPQYLLPELENRQFKLVKKEIDENNLELIIYK